MRHEEAAAFMACAYAKYTGHWASASPPPAPAAFILLNGLYDAKMDGQPVLAITGMQFHDLIGTHTQQDVDLDKLYKDVCVYNAAGHGRRRTCRTSPTLACRHRSGASRRSAHLDSRSIFRSENRARRALASATSRAHVSKCLTRIARACRRTTICSMPREVLNAGKKIAILAGPRSA